jgi:hypothetical protein
MSLAPKSEWDWLLQSTMRLKAGVGLRFDTRGGYCLNDMRSGRFFGLESWQIRLLRGIDAGQPFADTVRDILSDFPQLVSRASISSFVRGLAQHDFIEIQGARRPSTESIARRRHLSRGWLSRWIPDISRFWIAEATAFALVVSGVWTQQNGSATAADGTAPRSSSYASAPETLAWGMETGVPVRVWCRGIITAMLVREGDAVQAGDILARVADPMAQATCDDLRQQLGESRVQRDQYYSEGNLVAYLRETKAMAQLAGVLGEWEAQSVPIALRAPVDGLIRHKIFAEGIGNPVRPGDVLMTIETVEARRTDELVATSR